jgi:hypothetical protein
MPYCRHHLTGSRHNQEVVVATITTTCTTRPGCHCGSTSRQELDTHLAQHRASKCCYCNRNRNYNHNRSHNTF